MAHIDEIRAALRTASVAAGALDQERATAQTALDEAQALLLDVRAEAEATEAALRARIAELEGQTQEPDPPIIVDPPPPPVVGNAPSFAEFAFASRMPAFPVYEIPTEAACDWVLDRAGLVARSRRGLANIAWDATAPGVAGACYRASLAAGHGPRVTIGVLTRGGQADVGGFYSGTAPHDVAHGQAPIDVQFVGLTPEAEITLRWGGPTWDVDYGRTERCAAFGLGLVGSPSTHAIVQNRPSWDNLILDDWWLLGPEGGHVDWHAGLHLANWHTTVLRRQRRKARPGREPVKFSGHSQYLKSSSRPGSSTWVVECDLRGGNQTGVQKRPGRDNPYLGKPADTFVLADNLVDSHGYDHVSEGGGAALTVYAGPQTFIVRNRARNCRYMALLVSAQPRYTGASEIGPLVDFDRNWYDDDGYALGEVYIDGNDFGNVGSQRHCVSINHARRVFYGDKNRVEGRLVFGQVGYREAAKPSERVMLVGDFSKFPTPYTAVDAVDVRMGSTEMAALHVPTWGEALQ